MVRSILPPDVPTPGAEGFDWSDKLSPAGSKRRTWIAMGVIAAATALCGWQAYIHTPSRCISVVEIRGTLQSSSYVPPAGLGEAEFAVITASREVRP